MVDVRANVTLIGFLIDELTDVFARAIVNIFSGLGIVVEGNVLAAVVVTALEFTISPSLKVTLCVVGVHDEWVGLVMGRVCVVGMLCVCVCVCV